MSACQKNVRSLLQLRNGQGQALIAPGQVHLVFVFRFWRVPVTWQKIFRCHVSIGALKRWELWSSRLLLSPSTESRSSLSGPLDPGRRWGYNTSQHLPGISCIGQRGSLDASSRWVLHRRAGHCTAPAQSRPLRLSRSKALELAG